VGRFTLPADARPRAGEDGALRAVSRATCLLLQSGQHGAPIHVDARGRVVLPMWLRRLTVDCGSVLVAARWPEVTCLVDTPSTSLDSLVDAVVGEVA
jgi:hypothetical protein